MKILGRYSFGIGDRFAHQARAQLQAFVEAASCGVDVVPIWNKSNREHLTIGSEPGSVRAAADRAVAVLGWSKPYYVDADHIRLETVERFLDSSDFYTIDVADWIGQPPDADTVSDFIERHGDLIGVISIPGIESPFETSRDAVTATAVKYLLAVQEAGRIYRRIAAAKGEGGFVTEVSMDETDSPQTPAELMVILAAIADEGIPIQTIAPKFTGRFNKGVDYVGDIAQFEREFNDDLAVIAWAIEKFDLPGNLKLSVHSGSDKFSIYQPIKRALGRFNAGLHIKTAGTTWLEEVIGLAEAGDEGLVAAREVYEKAYAKREALCAPYASVIDIEDADLPSPAAVNGWTSEQFVRALRHNQSDPLYNPSLRQLIHVGYKVAAQLGARYLDLLAAYETTIAANVTGNLYERHLKPLLLDRAEAAGNSSCSGGRPVSESNRDSRDIKDRN